MSAPVATFLLPSSLPSLCPCSCCPRCCLCCVCAVALGPALLSSRVVVLGDDLFARLLAQSPATAHNDPPPHTLSKDVIPVGGTKKKPQRLPQKHKYTSEKGNRVNISYGTSSTVSPLPVVPHTVGPFTAKRPLPSLSTAGTASGTSHVNSSCNKSFEMRAFGTKPRIK